MINRFTISMIGVALLLAGSVVHGQHLENRPTGKVSNRGVIRFVSDSGAFRNAAPYTNITNNVLQFEGTQNRFTDLSDNMLGLTALGRDPSWRVPGLVRYQRDSNNQRVHGRYYTNLELREGASRTVENETYVSEDYRIIRSGDRTYLGIFGYDGTRQQDIAAEGGLLGVNRYRDLRLLNGPKRLPGGSDANVSETFLQDPASPLRLEGNMRWGTTSDEQGTIEIVSGGSLRTGSGQTDFRATVQVFRGSLVIPDDAGLVIVHPAADVSVKDDGAALMSMGVRAQMDVQGRFVNAYGPLLNTTFHSTSLVNYVGTSPQVIQATAADSPYGRLRTAGSTKTASGNVFLASDLSVNDENVTMVPHVLTMRTDSARYTSNAEVVGGFRRTLDGAVVGARYTYNNAETQAAFDVLPQQFTLDVRPATQPNAFDAGTDVNRKITVTAIGPWTATIRAGYKATDMPTAWTPGASEQLLKMYNAYAPPGSRALKLTPTVPPTYERRTLAQSSGLAYLELRGLSDTGPDNTRIDNGNDLLLRGSRDVLRAIVSGRWSNPNTWDEGREPEPQDRVIIDGFTVHVGYVRANDNYAINEAYPDSMATNVLIGTTANSSLVFGGQPSFATFSLVPDQNVTLTSNRIASGLVPTATPDTGSAPIDGGLVLYPIATFTTPNLVLGTDATIFNAGTLIVGASR
ncbi:MAG: hypothetical protein MUC47_05290 [Candidatus Kapabacteria bacterium]|nr:hypothetical protein [Candidatus Kapabacteria bacterium]